MLGETLRGEKRRAIKIFYFMDYPRGDTRLKSDTSSRRN